MQKSWKRGQPAQSQRRYPSNIPEVVSIDVLATMTDDDIISRMRVMEDDRQKVNDAGMDPIFWEIEAAYVRREMMIRRARREAHERYMRGLEQEYSVSEASLPAADLDNSNFLKAIGEWN